MLTVDGNDLSYGFILALCNTYCRLKYRFHSNPVCKIFLTPVKPGENTFGLQSRMTGTVPIQ